ncbi:hypothetical protein J6590_086019 [Homalodisca vitripennis]|nr:hypothetical protein J6590_086019 [Homalodisca vitripennis]
MNNSHWGDRSQLSRRRTRALPQTGNRKQAIRKRQASHAVTLSVACLTLITRNMVEGVAVVVHRNQASTERLSLSGFLLESFIIQTSNPADREIDDNTTISMFRGFFCPTVV